MVFGDTLISVDEVRSPRFLLSNSDTGLQSKKSTKIKDMKTLKMIGTVLFAAILGLNFSACKDDDDNNGNGINLNLLEGTWGRTNYKGWEKDRPDPEPKYFDYYYDPYNPTSYDDTKIEIHKLNDNLFSVLEFYYRNFDGWHVYHDESVFFKVNENRLVGVENYYDEEVVTIVELTANKLIIHISCTDEGEEYEETHTFIRM